MPERQPYDGGDGRPNPQAATNAPEFVARMRMLKGWCGNPSYQLLSQLSGVPRSTLADALTVRGGRLPSLEVVRRFVAACGLRQEEIAVWETTWRRLSAELVEARYSPGVSSS